MQSDILPIKSEHSGNMGGADPDLYLKPVCDELQKKWPENRTVNIVCHGHSVPAGYTSTPNVDGFHAYPRQLYRELTKRFPFAVLNVIVTAVGGEDSAAGAERFSREVLCHRPDVVLLDYGLNDRRIGLESASSAWASMLDVAKAFGCRILVLTPTPDLAQNILIPGFGDLEAHAEQIRHLAADWQVGLVDSLRVCNTYAEDGELSDLMSWHNHPNRRGHTLVTREILRWFSAE